MIVWNFVQIDWGGFWVLILETSFCCYVMILHDMVHEVWEIEWFRGVLRLPGQFSRRAFLVSVFAIWEKRDSS